MNIKYLIFFLILSNFSLTDPNLDLWDEIRSRMIFNHSLDRSSVSYELEKYNDNQYVINRLAKNGQRYLHYTVNQTLLKNLR